MKKNKKQKTKNKKQKTKNKKQKAVLMIMMTLFCVSASLIGNKSVTYAAKKAPSASGYVNLKNGSYTTDDTEIKYKVYTNVCFTGVKKIIVDVGPFSLSRKTSQVNKSTFEVQLYTADKKHVETCKIGEGGGIVTFKELDATKKYYVVFEKTDDTKYYSFKATISGK